MGFVGVLTVVRTLIIVSICHLFEGAYLQKKEHTD